MAKYSSRAGSAHIVLIILAVIIIISALGFVFWQSISRKLAQNDSQTNAKTTISTEAATNENVSTKNWEVYNSVLDSGLSYKYPSSWYSIGTEKEVTFSNGMKSMSHLLTSKKLTADSKGKPDDKLDQYMCVTFTEMSGPGSYKHPVMTDATATENFTTGASSLSLLSSHTSGNMQVTSNDPIGKYGASYLPLKNDHFVLVTGQYNCYSSGVSKYESLSDRLEYKQAKDILKSIKLGDA